MDKYGLLHTEAVFWRMASQSSRSPGSRAPFGGRGGLTQCLWTEDRSCHPQRQPLTSMWRQSVAGQTQSSALQRQWRLGVELADGRQVIVTEGVVDALVAVEWLPCPGARRIGRGAGSGALMLPEGSQSRTTGPSPRPPLALKVAVGKTRGISHARSPPGDAGMRGVEPPGEGEGGVLHRLRREGWRGGGCAGRESGSASRRRRA